MSLPPARRTSMAASDAKWEALRQRILNKELRAARAASSEFTFKGPLNSAAERREALSVLSDHVAGSESSKKDACDTHAVSHADSLPVHAPPAATPLAAAVPTIRNSEFSGSPGDVTQTPSGASPDAVSGPGGGIPPVDGESDAQPKGARPATAAGLGSGTVSPVSRGP